jgi:hypothetical protein
MEHINTIRLKERKNDAVSLISNHPLTRINEGNYSSSIINQLYQVHGISNYRDFIYPSLAQSSQDMAKLTNILASNSDVDSRFTSLVFQDMIRDHSENVLNLSHKFIKSAFKFTVPLAASVLLLGGLSMKSGGSQFGEGVETPITVIKIVECYLI